MSALVAARDLHRSFGATRAVDGVSLTLNQGEAYGLVGPDGAGKTTTLRLLVGALTADSGSVSVLGHDVAREVVELERFGPHGRGSATSRSASACTAT